jgi:plastocyanin domain-containing protein
LHSYDNQEREKMNKVIKEVLGWLVWILISPLVLIGLIYLWFVDIKQKAEWSESWNNYKPNE